MTSHAEQVATVLKKAVQDVLSRGLSDPRVRGLISITSVKVSPDMAHADVWVSVLPAEHASLSMRGLVHASAHIRSQISRTLSLRRVPRLSFHLDESLKKQAAIHAAINQAVQDSGDEPAKRPNESEDLTQ